MARAGFKNLVTLVREDAKQRGLSLTRTRQKKGGLGHAKQKKRPFTHSKTPIKEEAFHSLEDARRERGRHSGGAGRLVPVDLAVVAHEDALAGRHVANELAAERVDRHLEGGVEYNGAE